MVKKYKYCYLTADLLEVLPEQPMTFAELLSDLKSAKKFRKRYFQMNGAYGPIAELALKEAIEIKYKNYERTGS